MKTKQKRQCNFSTGHNAFVNCKDTTSGITLIALIITIIVLLILAGISIATLAGDNGVLTKASDAKIVNEIGSVKDEINLKAAEAMSDYYEKTYVSNTGESAYDKAKLVETIMKKIAKEYVGNEAGGTKEYGTYTVTISGTGAGATITIQSKAVPSLKTVGTMQDDGKIEWGDNYKRSSKKTEENVWTYDHASQTVTNGTLTLKIGDYVNDKGTQTVEGFDGSWRVLGVENGQLLLVTATYYAPFEEKEGFTKVQVGPSDYGLKLEGVDGWNNGVSKLKSIGSTYNNDKVEKGRSITVEDINKITGYNPNNTGVNDPNQTGTGTPYGSGEVYQYKNKVTYTLKAGVTNSGKTVVWYKGDKAETSEKESSYESFKPIGQNGNITQPYTVDESTAYYYFPTTLTETSNDSASVDISNSSPAYDMLFKTPYSPYWLASPCVIAGGGSVSWCLFCVPSGMVAYNRVWDSNNGSGSSSGGVRPAVSLKSNITPEFKSTNETTGISTYEI